MALDFDYICVYSSYMFNCNAITIECGDANPKLLAGVWLFVYDWFVISSILSSKILEQFKLKHFLPTAFTMPIYFMHSCGNSFKKALFVFWVALVMIVCMASILIIDKLIERKITNAHPQYSEAMFVCMCCFSIGNDCKFLQFNDMINLI